MTDRELLELAADAERYRWIRDRHENTVMDLFNSRVWNDVDNPLDDYRAQLDVLIDEEIAQEKKRGRNEN